MNSLPTNGGRNPDSNAEQQAAEALVAVGRQPSNHQQTHQQQQQQQRSSPYGHSYTEDEEVDQLQDEPKRKRARKSKKDDERDSVEMSSGVSRHESDVERLARAAQEVERRGHHHSHGQQQQRIGSSSSSSSLPHFRSIAPATAGHDSATDGGREGARTPSLQDERLLLERASSPSSGPIHRPHSTYPRSSYPGHSTAHHPSSLPQAGFFDDLPGSAGFRAVATSAASGGGARHPSGFELPPIDSYMSMSSRMSDPGSQHSSSHASSSVHPPHSLLPLPLPHHAHHHHHHHHHPLPSSSSSSSVHRFNTPPRPSSATSASSFRHSEVPPSSGTGGLGSNGYLDGPPTRAELERHYGLLKEERARLEAMVGVTDRMLENVGRALRGSSSSPDVVGERDTVMSNVSGSGGGEVNGGGGEAVRLRRDRTESSFGGESVWAVSSSSSAGSIVLVEGTS